MTNLTDQNNGNTVMVYCPRGCNVSRVSKKYPRDECASCGSVMTQDESPYDAVHEAIEEWQIASFEEQMASER